MAWFTPDFNRFFKELAAHNDREWFTAHRTRYEQHVKRPFEAFVAEAIHRIAKLDKAVTLLPKDAIFRIHKDVRFSKDKSPYKLEASAIISPMGRKDHGTPGIYFAFGPEAVRFYGGCYMPDKDQLRRIRETIVRDGAGLRKAIGGQDFPELFGTVQGDANKVLPPEFKMHMTKEPLIANKQFYVAADLKPSLVTDPGLMDLLMRHYAAMRPLNKWLAKAMG